MPTFVWISLGVFVVCLVAGAIWVTVMALRAWRRGRPALTRMLAESAVLGDRATELERRTARLEPKTAELQRGTMRLGRSLARARLQLQVIREASGIVSFALAFVPRK